MNPAAYRTRYPDLAGESVFISGGASGIGAEIVTAFAFQESRVHFVDIDAASGEALADWLETTVGRRPVFSVCDVTDTDALGAAVRAAADAEGRLATLVNNAARDLRVPVDKVDPAQWRDLVDVNLAHQFFASQAARPLLRASDRGSIVNFGSIAPTIAVPDLSVYSACKAAVFGLTRSLARDFGGEGIRVNSVVPGAILTERQLRDWISEEDKAAILERQCLKRPMAGDDVAEMVLFLASTASRGCTGQEFKVDGGNF